MLSYADFIVEGKGKRTEISGRVMTTNSNPNSTLNYADETIEGLRRKLIDLYFAKTEDKSKRETINKCLSTYVYALDKKLKISSDIIDMLAKAVDETAEETRKTLAEETDKFYGETPNHYGTTS
jgi:hypothetical protein